MISQQALEKRRARDRAKAKRRRERKRMAKLAILSATQFSKTSAKYRNLLPPMPEMSKSEMRNMLAAAVRNTALLT